MNIDNVNSNPLLSSPAGNESLQYSIPSDGSIPTEFSSTLMEKVKQLKSVDGNGVLLENLDLTIANELQNVAGLLGNFLPNGNNLKKEFDLDSILDGIVDVATTLEDVTVESTELEIKLTELVEEIEAIQTGIPNQIELDKKLAKIAEEVQQIQETLSKLPEDEEHDNISRLVSDLELIKQNTLENEQIKVKPHPKDLENLELDDSLELENKINFLAQEIHGIKEMLAEKLVVNTNLNNDASQVEINNADVNALPLVNQSTIAVDTLEEPKKLEAIATTVVQHIKQNNKKDNLLLKPTSEEKSSDLSTKIDSTSLSQSQQENAFRKPEQDSLFMNSKQNGLVENVNFKEMDIGSEKTLPKFTTDIAMLNRAIVSENKSEIPPMTKHFSHPEWNKEMGERIVWMHKQAIPSAELRLNPEHLGPIRIKIDVSQDQAIVAFTTQHAVVKEAIEASLPKLRELFSAQQLNLSDVNVSQNNSEQKQSKGFEQMGQEAGGDNRNDNNEIVTTDQTENTMEIIDEIEAGRAIANNGVLSIFA